MKRNIVVLFALLTTAWMMVGCYIEEVPGEDLDFLADQSNPKDRDYACNTEREPDIDTAYEWECGYSLDEPRCYDEDCDYYLYNYYDCVDQFGQSCHCEELVDKYKWCIDKPEEPQEPQNDCETIEEAYRDCANDFGPDYPACTMYGEELMACWLTVEDGWCDKLESAYNDCTEQFGYYHYACNQFRWDLEDDCNYYDPGYGWDTDYDNCWEREQEYEYCVQNGGWEDECEWLLRDLEYECWGHGDISDTDWGWDVDIDTGWDEPDCALDSDDNVDPHLGNICQ